MIAVMFDGFLTGLILQIAIGPVFFFILNITLQKSWVDGLLAVAAVTIVDYMFIALAVLGVGKLLEKPETKRLWGTVSSLVLILFGIIMMVPIDQGSGPQGLLESNGMAGFMAVFLLTASSPLTIVFWTSVFAAKAIERGFAQKQLIFFGLAAGLATLVFLGASVALLSMCRASIPLALIRALNTAVGLLLVIYGIRRWYNLMPGRIKSL